MAAGERHIPFPALAALSVSHSQDKMDQAAPARRHAHTQAGSWWAEWISMAMGELGMVNIKQQKEGTLHNHLWDLES